MLRRWISPASLLAVGLALAAGGVGWAVATGVALPDQDPTPDMVAYTAAQMRVVDSLLVVGMALALAGLVWAALRLVRTLGGAMARSDRDQ